MDGEGGPSACSCLSLAEELPCGGVGEWLPENWGLGEEHLSPRPGTARLLSPSHLAAPSGSSVQNYCCASICGISGTAEMMA